MLYIFKIKSVLKQFTKNQGILISNDFIIFQLHLPRQKCVENVIKLFCVRFKAKKSSLIFRNGTGEKIFITHPPA